MIDSLFKATITMALIMGFFLIIVFAIAQAGYEQCESGSPNPMEQLKGYIKNE